MSVLTDSNQYACSSRVRGVFRYLLQKNGQREVREKLERYLSPESLIRGGEADDVSRSMIKGTVSECLKMKLLIADDDAPEPTVMINPELPEQSRSKAKGDRLLPHTLASLMINTVSDANRNLALVIAWYLAQDAYAAPGNWPDFQATVLQQIGAERLGMNDARYSQFADWICFLGFAWRHNLKGNDLLTPDPTSYLRSALKTVVVTGRQPQGLGEFITKLGEYCPVFETGIFRLEIEKKVKFRETEQHLSSTTSLALLRLQDEKLIQLSTRSDAPVYTFSDGQQAQSFTHIRLI